MKSIWIAIAVLGLLAAPSLAVINVKVMADDTELTVGQITTIRVLAQGTLSGLGALGGSIVASNPSTLQTVPGTFEWTPAFGSISMLPPALGSAADGGGWGGVGSMQSIYPPDPTFAKAEFVEVARYQVQGMGMPGVVTLSFQPGKFGGFLPAETSANQALGTLTSATITVPEPLSVALLALGGLAILRRRA
jgi:hypothetical protein